MNSKFEFSRGKSAIKELHRRALQLLNAQRFSEASELCLSILQQDNKHADAHFLLGVILFNKNQILKSIELIQKSIELNDSEPEYYAQLAKCYVLMKEDAKASEVCAQSLALAPKDALTLDTLGNIYSRLGDHRMAADCFQQAVDRDSARAEFHYNLASAKRFLGEFAAAERAYEKAIECEPGYYKAHSSLSTLRKQTLTSNHIDRLEKVLGQKKLDDKPKLHLYYALAKEYEDIEKYDLAFENLSKANTEYKKMYAYSIDQDRMLFDHIRTACDKGFLNFAHGGYSTQEPIFVLGMPRTGTTLVERILSSHSKVTTAGELQNFAVQLKRLCASRSNLILDEETIDRALQVDFAQLGKAYIESTRQITGNTPYFVDKLPMNFLYIGFIAMALPGAKIICLRRNPMDTCFSNYKQLFSVGLSYYHYSYDLEDVGHYYLLFRQLMQHWSAHLQDRLLEVDYELVVQDQVGQSRKILNWCGLDWEEACLNFYQNTAPVSTASSVQVRQPIYKTSIKRWKYYQQHLNPLKKVLLEGGISALELE